MNTKRKKTKTKKPDATNKSCFNCRNNGKCKKRRTVLGCVYDICVSIYTDTQSQLDAFIYLARLTDKWASPECKKYVRK